nr:uncharacterized protein LOC109776103 [Aegilops tauschii subsp. strangulata]
MATSSSSFPSSPFVHAATEKLTKGNQVLWRVSVLSAIWGAQMAKYLDVDQPAPPMEIEVASSDGRTTTKAPNPDFQAWYAQDQQVFSYLLTTLPREMATQDRPRQSAEGQLGKIRSLYDELIAARKKVDKEDIVSHILAELEEDFDPVVSAMCSWVEPVTMAELFSQLLSFETRMNLRGGGSQSSANAATRGRFAKNGGGSGDRGRKQMRQWW